MRTFIAKQDEGIRKVAVQFAAAVGQQNKNFEAIQKAYKNMRMKQVQLEDMFDTLDSRCKCGLEEDEEDAVYDVVHIGPTVQALSFSSSLDSLENVEDNAHHAPLSVLAVSVLVF